MADMPPAGLPPIPAAPPTWTPTPPAPRRTAPCWPGFTALGIALVAFVVAVAGWFRPPAPPPADTAPTYTDQQVADAKARACEAFDLVDQGVVLQTRPAPNDEGAMVEARAANARLAIFSGAIYLRDHVDPAAPKKLVSEIQHLSTIMLDLNANYVSGARDTDPAQAERLAEGEGLITRIEELCR